MEKLNKDSEAAENIRASVLAYSQKFWETLISDEDLFDEFKNEILASLKHVYAPKSAGELYFTPITKKGEADPIPLNLTWIRTCEDNNLI